MKYSRYLVMCLCASFLYGCDAELYKELETIPIESTAPVIVKTIEETGTELAEFVEKTENSVAYQISTVESSFDTDPIQEGYHLSTADENYKFENAYRTGDYSALTAEEIDLLNAALTIIDPVREMSDYTIAATVHDSMTEMIHYGYNDKQYTAYGALVGREAVCQGYAFAYKLCMDLAGIDCVTVGGTAVSDEGEQDHAWNMVKLGDFWYHIDVTWDDPTTAEDRGAWSHLYLFTDDDFILANHTPNCLVQGFHGVKGIPEAKDSNMSYLKLTGAWADSQEKLVELFSNAIATGNANIEIACQGFTPSIEFVKDICSCSYITQTVGDATAFYIMIQ